MRKHVAMLGALAGLMAMGAQAASRPTKEAQVNVRFQLRPSATMGKYFGASTPNPYKYTRTPKRNQRQKRKYWAQCPHKRPKR